MYHPASRLLTLLELLQAEGALSGGALARRLEVDVRTIRRYVAILQDRLCWRTLREGRQARKG